MMQKEIKNFKSNFQKGLLSNKEIKEFKDIDYLLSIPEIPKNSIKRKIISNFK